MISNAVLSIQEDNMTTKTLGDSLHRAAKLLSLVTLLSTTLACGKVADPNVAAAPSAPAAQPQAVAQTQPAVAQTQPTPPASPFVVPSPGEPAAAPGKDAVEPNRPAKGYKPAAALPEKKDITKPDRTAMQGMPTKEIAQKWPEHPLAQGHTDGKGDSAPSKTANVSDYLSQAEPYIAIRLHVNSEQINQAIVSNDPKKLKAVADVAARDMELISKSITSFKEIPFPEEAEALKHMVLRGLTGVMNAAEIVTKIPDMESVQLRQSARAEFDAVLYSSLGDLEANAPKIISALREQKK